MEDQEVRTGSDHVPGSCPREYIFLQDLVRLEVLLQTQQGEKEELVKVRIWFHLLFLWVDAVLCRHIAPPMEWKGNFSSSALWESPGANGHDNLALGDSYK